MNFKDMDENIIDFYKENISDFVELVIEKISLKYIRVKVRLRDIPSNIHKVTLNFDSPISILQESEKYTISPSKLEFSAMKELYIRISRFNGLPTTNDIIVIPIQAEINDEIISHVFQKELEVKIERPETIALIPRPTTTYAIYDIKKDGKIVTDRPIQLKIKNIGDKEIVLTSQILEIEDYTEPDNLTSISGTPLGIVKIEQIIPEQILLNPKQELSVELRLSAVKEFPPSKPLILKIYSILSEEQFNVIYLYKT